VSLLLEVLQEPGLPLAEGLALLREGLLQVLALLALLDATTGSGGASTGTAGSGTATGVATGA
jgi:hypothetical protein